MVHHSARQAFTAALDTLVGQVQQDRSILATLLCGSLSHDTVWAKSDIDLVLVTIDDSKDPCRNKCANHERRGARLARRGERAYRAYVSDEQRSQAGCIGGQDGAVISVRLIFTYDEFKAAVASTSSSRNQ